METIIAAADFFAAKLSYETDPADLAAIHICIRLDRCDQRAHPLGRLRQLGGPVVRGE